MPPAPRMKFRSVFVSNPQKWRFFDAGNAIFEAKASVLTSGSYFQLDLMIETQFRNFQIYFRHIVFDEVPSKNLEALLVIREGYTRCPAHQWMRVEKLVSMLLVSARDLNPQIKIFKKTFRTSVRRPTWGWGKVPIINLGFEKYFFPTLDIASGGNKISDFLTLGLKTHDFDLGHCLRRQQKLGFVWPWVWKAFEKNQTCFKCTLNLGPGTLKVR